MKIKSLFLLLPECKYRSVYSAVCNAEDLLNLVLIFPYKEFIFFAVTSLDCLAELEIFFTHSV